MLDVLVTETKLKGRSEFKSCTVNGKMCDIRTRRAKVEVNLISEEYY